jgi:hypothetical protein
VSVVFKYTFSPLTGKFHAYPQPSGTPDGTKYWRDDNTWATPPGGSGTFSISQIEIDLGWPAVTEKELTIIDAGVSAGMKINASVAYEDTADKTADEIIVSQVSCAAGKAAAGSYKLGIFAAAGPIGGKFKIDVVKSA